MKILASLLGILPTTLDVPAQDAMGQVARSAAESLARSSEELAKLREAIAAEQLPLAQELTAAEETLVELRREHDRATREADVANLDLPRIREDITFRENELVYVGNLLDEYARSFESKVHVSELQYCGEAVATAKEATENTTLGQDEKFEKQLAFLDVSIERLRNVLGGLSFPGRGVDAQGAVSEGRFAIVGPVALFSASSGAVAGLVVPQTGSAIPLIRPLEGALQAGLVALVSGNEGLLPLDPSRGGALKALVQKTNLIHIFEKGGPIMWPLLVASVLALGVVIERLVFLLGERRKRDPKVLEALFAHVERGDADGAIRAAEGSRFYVVRTLAYALQHKGQSLPNALLYAQAQELKRFRRGIPLLDTVITLAPLLGLLGTVTGMMGSFSLIGGELSAPGAITGGIAEALIATAFGLGIAITALLPFNFLNTKLEEARHELDSAATQLELLVHPQAPPAAASAPPVEVLVPRPAPVLAGRS